MSKKIVIDPITRIEGHLRIEVEVDENNIIQEAWASGTLFRGIETILKGRDPRDAGLIAQRICGVCTGTHYRASIEAVEDAYKITLPKNAQIVRNLLSMALIIQDHLVHFYHLHAPDYFDVVSALSADPIKASEEAERYTSHPYRNSPTHLEAVKERLEGFVKAGRLGPFSEGYWGHPAMKLSPEENLILISHYLEALRIQREMAKTIAIMGGKTPHPQTLVVGGVTNIADLLNPQRINDFIFGLRDAHDFVKRAYYPDTLMLVQAYREEIKRGDGRSVGNFFSVGGYLLADGSELFSRGVLYNHDFSTLHPFDESKIVERVERAWYKDGTSAHPSEGVTIPDYTDLNEDGTLKTEGKYSWIKAPRYDGRPMECGPLARMIIGFVAGNPHIKPFVDEFLEKTSLELIDLCSSAGRNAARALEALILSEKIFDVASMLLENLKYYDEESWAGFVFEELPSEGSGRCLMEVPRGVVGHFVNIKDRKILGYQAMVPTTWNASPKDSENNRGAYEESLIGLKLADPSRPLEVLRAIHSYDPCIACAVHVIDTKGRRLGEYRLQTSCKI